MTSLEELAIKASNKQKERSLAELERLKSVSGQLAIENLPTPLIEGNFSDELHLHKFESSIRNRIISCTLRDQGFWTYRSPGKTNLATNDHLVSTYTRALPPERLEERYFATSKYIQACVCFNSGSAAINAAIMISQKIMKASIVSLCGYFETNTLLRFMDTGNVFCNSKEQFLEKLKIFHFGIFEKPCGILGQSEINLDDLNSTVSAGNTQNQLTVLIIDDTLNTGSDQEINSFLKVKSPLIILKVRSGLKLDQCGLELFNFGIIEIMTNLDTKHAEYFAELLRSYRTVSGLSIDYNSYLRFEPKLFESSQFISYRNLIGENTRQLVKKFSARDSSMFTIGYNDGWPFFYLLPTSPTFSMRTWAISLINTVVKLGGYLPFGTSFGLRHTRIDVIDKQFLRCIRVAPGAYLGASTNVLIERAHKSE